jgi:hypothetical protein
MKKYFLLALSFLLCAGVYASPPEQIVTLSGKAILSSEQGYYVLSDSTCWKVINFSKRWRSPLEWWNNVQLAPETFDCIPSSWDLGASIDVYSKFDFPEIPLENASNKTDLVNCTHVLVNSVTNQVLFGTALETADCMVRIFNEAYKDGHDIGYSRGHDAGYSSGHDAGYNTGYSTGYTIGYNKGFCAQQEQGPLQNKKP